MNKQEPTQTPSFREVFREVGQETLDKNRVNTQVIVSVAPLVTGLMILGTIGYYLTPYITLIALLLALIALWGRWVLQKQALGDLRDMKLAQKSYSQGQQPEECVNFIRLRSTQMFQDNKMLSSCGKAQVESYQRWAVERT